MGDWIGLGLRCHYRQLGRVRGQAPHAIVGQSRGEGGPASAKALIIAAPTRSQLAAVSAIKILLVGVERLILAPQLTQAIASFLTKTVTTFSVCWPHFWQRIRSMVQSAVEKFIKPDPGAKCPNMDRPKPYPKDLNFLQSVGGTARPFYPAPCREQLCTWWR